MKVKKLLLLMLALMLSLTLAVSCGDDGGDSSQGGGDTSGGGSGDTSGGGDATGNGSFDGLFGKGCRVNIIYNDEENAKSSANKLYSAIYTATGVSPSENGTGEYDVSVILGESTHPASVAAYRRLSRLQKTSDDFLAYVVYSDGENFAIAYDIDERHAAALTGAGRLVDRLAQGAIEPGVGVLYKGTFDMDAYYQAEDEEWREEKWQRLAEHVGGELGEEIVAAFRDHYSLYSSDALTWLANLYEPYVCYCGTDVCTGSQKCGGAAFYYSNAARDNYGFLPDVESTYQALAFLANTGALDQYYGGNFHNAISEEMENKITHFVRSLQDEDGWFYHPQWDKDELTTNRRARDLVWCQDWLREVGVAPYYDTPRGMAGEGAPSLTSCRPLKCSSSVVAVSKVVSVESSASVPEHLLTKEALVEYLAGLDINGNSYYVCNLLSTQLGDFTSRDKTLSEQGANWRVLDVICDWLFEHQNPETGTWDLKKPTDAGYSDYEGVNGVLKIVGTITTAERLFPNWERAIDSCLKAINSTEPISGIVDIYNAFWALSNVRSNVRKFAADGDKKADAISKMMLESAPTSIRIATQKIAPFKKPDGSFSYGRYYSSEISQGMPVTLPKQVEGDVNGNGIAINGVTEHLYRAFGLGDYRVPIYTDNDRRKFFDIIDSLESVIKDESDVIIETIDFENDAVGSESLMLVTEMYSEGSAKVIVDPRDYDGKVLEFISGTVPVGNDTLRIDNPASVKNPSSFVFSADFAVLGNSEDFSIFIDMGLSYRFSLLVNKKTNTVEIWENSSTHNSYSMQVCLKDGIPIGEWFNVKAVYYLGDEDTVRIKFYVDGELIAVTDNFGNENGHKVRGLKYNVLSTFNYTEIFVRRSASAHLLIDNVYSYRDVARYEKATAEENPAINIDAADNGKALYDFDSSATLPESISASAGGGSVAVNNGYLSIVGNKSGDSASVRAPLQWRGEMASVDVFEADISVADAALGAIAELSFREDNRFDNDLMSYRLAVNEVDGEKYVSLHEAPDGILGSSLGGIKLALGEHVRLRIEYYEKMKTSAIYLNGEALTISSASSRGAIKYKAALLEIKTVKGAECELRVDNLTAEKIPSSFDSLTGAHSSSIIHTFANGLPEGAVASGSVAVGGGAAKFTGGVGALSIPVNRRMVLSSVYSAEMNLQLSSVGEGELMDISFVDSQGNKIVAFRIVGEGGRAYLYDLSEHGRTPKPICLISNKIKLAFDFYTVDGETVLYVGGKVQSVSGICYSESSFSAPAAYLRIEALAPISASVDNVLSEGRYVREHTRPEIEGKNDEDKAEVLTFEDSFTGNIPVLAEPTLVTNGADARIVGSYVDGVFSKALAFDTSTGSGDKVCFLPAKTLSSANYFAFESDIKIDSSLATTLYQLAFVGEDGAAAYMINVNLTAQGTVTLQETSHTTAGNKKQRILCQNSIEEGEWFRLKLEYYEGTRDTVRIKITVNGELLYISDNFYNSHDDAAKPGQNISKVRFSALNASIATIAFDNVKFEQLRGTCEDEVGKAPNAEDAAETLTFESSSTNSVPKTVTYSLKSGGGAIDVIEDSVYGTPSKVLEFLTGRGANDRVVVSTTKPLEVNNGAIFTADMNVTSEMTGAIWQIFFGAERDDGNLDAVYMIQLELSSDGKVSFLERASSTSSLKVNWISEKSVSVGEWFNFKLEFFRGDRDSVRMKFYLDGECVYISNNFYGNNIDGATPNEKLSAVRITSLSSASGRMLLDNVSLKEHNGVCTDHTSDYKPPVVIEDGPGLGAYADEATAEGYDSTVNGYLSGTVSQSFEVPESLSAGDVFVFEHDFRWTELYKGAGSNPTWVAHWNLLYDNAGTDTLATTQSGRLMLVYNGGLNAFLTIGGADYKDNDGDGVADGSIATLEHGKWYNIRYEVHQTENEDGTIYRELKVFLDGIPVGSLVERTAASARLTPYSVGKFNVRTSGSFDFDNVYVGAYTPVPVLDEGPAAGKYADNEKTMTYSDKATGSTTVKTSTSFAPAEGNTIGNLYVFEADIRWNDMKVSGSSNPNWSTMIYLQGSSGGNTVTITDQAERLTVVYDGDGTAYLGLGLYNYKDENSDGFCDRALAAISRGEWVTVRYEVEITRSASEGGDGYSYARSVRLYVNGSLVAESNQNGKGADYELVGVSIGIRTGADYTLDNVYVGAENASVTESEE